MSTIVTKLGTAAENLDGGLFNSVSWFNTSNALTNDNQNAIASFSVGYTFTQYLYVRDFEFSIPVGAIIDGIAVRVKKKAIGPVSDLGVYLVFDDTGASEFTPENKASENPWTSVYQTIEYGGPTDTWGVDWTNTAFNNESFGIVLSAMGDGSINNGVFVDYFEIDVHYHFVHNITPTGGVRCAGTAIPTGPTSGVPSGGIRCAGHGLINYDEKGTGGSVVGGDSPNEAGVFPTGGLLATTGADVQFIFDPVQASDTFFTFYALGRHDVPPDNAHPDKLAYVWFDLDDDPLVRRATWFIRHNLTNIDRLDYMGPAKEGEEGTVHFSLHLYYDMTSPITASVTITPEEVVATKQGLGYLFFEDQSTGTTLRGQMRNSPAFVSGSATVQCNYNHAATGGSYLNSSWAVQVRYRPAVDGGGGAAGDSKSYVQANVGGGILLNSSTPPALSLNPILPVSGAILGGTGGGEVTYTLTPSPAYGVIVSGDAVRVLVVPIATGVSILAGGHGPEDKIVPVYVDGGAWLNGTMTLQQTYAAQDSVGGVKIFGSWPPEKLKTYTKAKHINYALLMKSENILNKTPTPANAIMNPFASEMPAVQENPFSAKHQPGWCDFWDACDSAYLPKVIQRRQKNYLPPKQGGTVVTNRAIAQIDG